MTIPSLRAIRRNALGVNPIAAIRPSCRARCSMLSRKSIATSSTAAMIRKKLKAMNNSAKSVLPLLAANCSARIGRNVIPIVDGSIHLRSSAENSLALSAGMRRLVTSPNGPPHSFRAASRLTNSFGAALYCFQYASSSLVTQSFRIVNPAGASQSLILPESVNPL